MGSILSLPIPINGTVLLLPPLASGLLSLVLPVVLITSVGILGGLTVTAPISGSVTGNAGTVTNGVYTTGDQTIGGVKTFNSAVNADLIGDVTGMIKTTGTDTYVDVSDLERRINTFDYGVINPVFVDPIRYYLYAVGTDMGTFNNPSEFGIDAGTL